MQFHSLQDAGDLEQFRLQWQREVRNKGRPRTSSREGDRRDHLKKSKQDRADEERQSIFEQVC